MADTRSKAEKKGDALLKLQLDGRVGVPDAAAIFGIHPYTLRDYIQSGKVSAMHIGKRPYIFKDEIDRFLEQGPLTENA